MSDKLKKLTGKNPKDFEQTAKDMLNLPDIQLFEELVQSEDYLFDFIKQNVSNRINNACSHSNYKNLLKFFKYYSPSYEEVIISNLVKFADEDLTDCILELFETGTDEEKTYCAKYFGFIQDPLSLDFLKRNAYSENSFLSSNCASTLAIFEDREIYNDAIQKLDSDDEFEVLEGVKFLVSYGDKQAVSKIIETLKKSSMSENIAGELPYLAPLTEILNKNKSDGLFVLNTIISGLGEILPLGTVFDFELYNIFETILNNQISSESAVVLLNAMDKFSTLTENDEYLYDESKDVKQEVIDIKNSLFKKADIEYLQSKSDEELNQNSLFIYSALEFTKNNQKVRELLSCDNQTIILKSAEILKKLNSFTQEDKDTAVRNIKDENIKSIIMAL